MTRLLARLITLRVLLGAWRSRNAPRVLRIAWRLPDGTWLARTWEAEPPVYAFLHNDRPWENRG